MSRFINFSTITDLFVTLYHPSLMGHPLSCCQKFMNLDIQNDNESLPNMLSQKIMNPDILLRDDVILISKLGSL